MFAKDGTKALAGGQHAACQFGGLLPPACHSGSIRIMQPYQQQQHRVRCRSSCTYALAISSSNVCSCSTTGSSSRGHSSLAPVPSAQYKTTVVLTCPAVAAAAASTTAAAAAAEASLGLEGWIASQIIISSSGSSSSSAARVMTQKQQQQQRRRRLQPQQSKTGKMISLESTAAVAVAATSSSNAKQSVSGTTTADTSQEQQQQQQQYPSVDPTSGQIYVDPSTIPARPWAAAAAAAASSAAAAAAAEAPAQINLLVQRIADVSTTSSSSSSSEGSSSSTTAAAATATSVDEWDDAFVQQLLSAVSTAQRSSSSSQSASIKVRKQQRQHDQPLAVQQQAAVDALDSSSSITAAVQQQQQQALTLSSVQQQQEQEAQAAAAVQDPRVLELLSLIKPQQQQPRAQQVSRLATSVAYDTETSAAATAGWGYISSSGSSGGSYGSAPCLLRAQWVAEEMYRLQYNTASMAGSSSSDLEQQQQQGLADLLPELNRQLQGLLVTHLRTEAASWQDVARVYDTFVDYLNPNIACWCLTALQKMYKQGLVAVGRDKEAVLQLVQRLLGLVWQWQQQLGPRECVAVAWALVNLRIKAPAMRDPMRNALTQRYITMLAAERRRLARQRWRHNSSSRGSSQGPQQQQLLLLPWSEHAALLLGLSRLQLQAHTDLPAGTSKVIGWVVSRQIQLELQQQQQQQKQPRQQQQQQQVIHLVLLLYALSELSLTAHSSVLHKCCHYTLPLLQQQQMRPRDLAMLAVAFGRFGYVKAPQEWRQAFFDATAAAAAASAAVEDGSTPPSYYSLTAAANVAAAADSSSNDDSSSSSLNPADITSILTAVHSMKLQPPETWLDAMLQSALVQLEQFNIQQCIILLLALSRLEVRPKQEWLVAVAEHVHSLANTYGSSSSYDQQQQQQQQQHHSAAAVVGVLSRPPPQQQQQYYPKGWHSKICLYLLALSKVVLLLPSDQAVQMQLQLKPWITAVAKQLAPAMHLLAPLDLVQMMLGLWQLNCRPGPGFMSSHMSCCDAAHRGFSGSMLRELSRAYQGLGFQPSQSLTVLMYSKMEHSSSSSSSRSSSPSSSVEL